MNASTQVPPGFRFHPTDEELVDYYLRRKVSSTRIDVDVIKEIHLYKIEPWDLQELCKWGDEDQSEYYFFSHKDKKYPTGTRTNRATRVGFWKATGRDKAIYCKHDLIGMRKTLVFYKGRAPNGQKSDWIMHEYRLQTHENGPPQEEGWAVCKVFKKRTPTTMRRMNDHESPYWYEDQVTLISDLDSPQPSQSNPNSINFPSYNCKTQLNHHQNHHLNFQIPPQNHANLIHLPLFEHSKMALSPSLHGTSTFNNSATTVPYGLDMNLESNNTIMRLIDNNCDQDVLDQVTDWRVLDKFVASQLSQDDVAKASNNTCNRTSNHSSSGRFSSFDRSNKDKESLVLDNKASTPTSTSQIDIWK